MPRKIGRRRRPGRKVTQKKAKVVVVQQPLQNPVNIYLQPPTDLRPAPAPVREVAIQPTMPQQLAPIRAPLTPLYAASSQTFVPSDPSGAPALTPVVTKRKCSVCGSSNHVKNKKDHPESY
jgi:hypothetical protein